MARPISWRQLVPGLVVTAVLFAAVLAVFRFARVGALRCDTMHVYALTDDATGLVQGAEVWLGGQKVGVVRSIGFAPAATDTNLRVVVAAEVLADRAPHLRRDSFAEIRAGGNLIGARVLTISAGTSATPPLRDGDTLSTRAQPDLELVTSRAALASRDFPAIIANVKVLSTQLGSASSTVGAILASEAGGEQLAALGRQSARLAAVVGSGRGTIGRALNGEAADRARRAAAVLDALRSLLGSAVPRLGAFRRDSSLLRSVEDLRYEVTMTRALLDEPRGTAGRALKDEAIAQEMTAAEVELTALIADIKARPLRYVAF